MIVEILEFDKVKNLQIVPFSDFRAVMRQSLLEKDMPWVLKIYANKKLIYKQRQDEGWSAEELFSVEQAAKIFSS